MYAVSIEQRFGIAVLRNRKFCKRCMTSNARPNSTEHQPLMIGSAIWLLAGTRILGDVLLPKDFIGRSVTNRMDGKTVFMAFLWRY